MLSLEGPRLRRSWMWPLVVFGLGAIVFVVQLAGVAQSDAQNVAAASSWQDDHDAEAPTEDEGVEADDGPRAERLADAEQLREGAQAYSQMCASCHQAGGIGIVGQFPPLRDNPNVDDGDYLRTVITTGRAGELEVDGVLYDGVMPSFSTLPDDDTDAIVAFIQNDFVAPPIAIIPQAGPIAGTELPGFSNMAKWLSYLIAGTAALLVLAPRITSANDRLSFPWLDAWLRTAIIVAAVILLIVVIPDWAVRNSAVTKLSRFSQDLIGVSLWLAGLVAVLWGLWYAQRESRL